MRFQKHATYGFTTKFDGIVSELANQVYVSEAHDQSLGTPEPIKKPYTAIWDTGATNTVISRRVVQELNLQPSGRATCQAVGEGDTFHSYETNTFFVNILLPNNVAIIGIRVSEGFAGCDVLIGMDVIANGDFAVTNYNGKTWCTFRVPSNEPIDFVDEIAAHNNKYKTKVHPGQKHERRKQGMRRKKR